MESYLEKAKRLTNGRVVGNGRYLLMPLDSPLTCFLFETRAEAERQVAQPERVRITDLDAPSLDDVLDRIPDRYDAEERKRARRERLAS